MILSGFALTFYAATSHPTGYSWDQVPQIFVRVIGRLIN